VLETQKPPNEVFRIGRKLDPWQPPDWSQSNPDGTFGNRFDDPEAYYRVLYASSQPISCFVETLARFRPDLALMAELREIDGEDDYVPVGQVPREWCDQRLLGTASAGGNYADIYAAEWISTLRRKLADECLRLGLKDLDAGILQQAPRRITQLASRQVYEIGLPGIYYRSRYGHNLENWAFFEPFQSKPTDAVAIAANNPTFLEVLQMLGLRLG
jgi:hypothetical protein